MPPHSRPTADRRSAPRTPSRTAPRAARSGEWEPRPPLPSPWPEPSPLLPSLSGDARKLLETLARALATVRPLRTAHRKALPRDIADLSRDKKDILLTNGVSIPLSKKYKASFMKGYLHYLQCSQ